MADSVVEDVAHRAVTVHRSTYTDPMSEARSEHGEYPKSHYIAVVLDH